MLKLSKPTTLILVMTACLLASPASSGDLVRVDIQTEAISNSGDCTLDGGVFGEECATNSDYFSCGAAVPFDLLDVEDDDSACFPPPSTDGVGQSDVSGGGRWKLATTGGDPPEPADRTVAINFSDTATTTDSGDCGALTALATGLGLGGEVGGDTCSCNGGTGNPDRVCFVQARMAADRAFKKGATRQSFSITVIKAPTPEDNLWRPALNINYIDPWYICPGFDNDSRILQTEPCGGGASVAEAEVCEGGDPNCSNSLGRWNLPGQIFLQKVPRPGDGGGGGPGGCNLGQKNDPCSTGADCCSGRCKRNGTCR